MRPVLLTCLILLGVGGLVFLGLVPASVQVQVAPPAVAQAQPAPPRAVGVRPTAPEPKKGGGTENTKITALGKLGVSQEDAEAEAIVDAQMKVEAYLRKLNPPVTWKPSEAFVRRHGLDKSPPRVVKIDIDDPLYRSFARELGQGDALVVEFDLEITQQVRREMLTLARQERSEQRMLALFPALGGMILVLLAAAVYIQLDERTKGYYTGWLRLAAGGAVAAVLVSGWWFFRH